MDNAGKTTILKAFNGEDISTISPTLGFNIQTLLFPPDFRLNVWDVGGQQTIRSYWRNYFEQTDGLVFVVDSADVRRLEEVREALRGLLQQEKLAGASLLVFANKQDLKGALSLQQIAEGRTLKRSDADGGMGQKDGRAITNGCCCAALRVRRCCCCVALDMAGLSEGHRHCHLASCSAVDGSGLQEGIQWIVSDIAARIYMME